MRTMRLSMPLMSALIMVAGIRGGARAGQAPIPRPDRDHLTINAGALLRFAGPGQDDLVADGASVDFRVEILKCG
jgi:hypothetical protein